MDFVGNQKKLAFLNRCLERGNLNHAYLFSGPEAVGKFFLAKAFSLAAITGKTQIGFNEKIASTDLLDLILVEPEIEEKKGVIKKKSIAVEAIRDAQNSLSLFPYYGAYKILIINDAHKLTVSAQNALLKTLEEPNKTAMLILITHENDRILPTIKSRCQVINFSLVSEVEMNQCCSEDSQRENDVLGLAMGRPGLLFDMLRDETRLNEQKEALKELKTIREATLNVKFKFAEDLAKNAPRTLEKLALWSWLLRSAVRNEDVYGIVDGYSLISKLDEAVGVLKSTNANPRLVLENLFMEI